MSSTNLVSVKYTIPAESILKAFPGAVSVNPVVKTSVVRFETPEAAAAAVNASTVAPSVSVEVQPWVKLTNSEIRQRRIDRYRQTLSSKVNIACVPDVSTESIPATAQVITIKDDVNPAGSGRLYKNTQIPTKHTQTIKFTPVAGSPILSDLEILNVQFKILKINVIVRDANVFVFVRIYHPSSGRSGDIVLRRIRQEDGTYAFSRRCFDILVDPEDLKKGPEEEIPIRFVSIESITLDPVTGLWSELKIALDEASVPLRVYRIGGRRPNNRFGNRGGRPQGGRGGRQPNRRGPQNRGPRRFNNNRQPRQQQQA